MSRQSVSLLAVLLALFCVFATSPTMAQERQYEVYSCKLRACLGQQMPLTITAVRNLQSADWWRELEVDVKNTSDKPVYFIRLIIGLPDTAPDQNSEVKLGLYGASLYYGRHELHNIYSPAEPRDTPLKPGETFIFRVPETSYVGFSRQPETLTKRLKFYFETINFGDNTGIVGGAPISRPPR